MSDYSCNIKENPFENLENYPKNFYPKVMEFNEDLNLKKFSRDLDDNDPLSKFICIEKNQILLGKNFGGTSRWGDNLMLYKGLIWIQENKSIFEKNQINMGKQKISSFKLIPKRKMEILANLIEKSYPDHSKAIKKLIQKNEEYIKIYKFYAFFELDGSFQKESGKIQILSVHVSEKISQDPIWRYFCSVETNLYYAEVRKSNLNLLDLKESKIYEIPNSKERDRGKILGKIILEENGFTISDPHKQMQGYDLVDSEGIKYEIKVYVSNRDNLSIQFESNDPRRSKEKIRYLIIGVDSSWKNSNHFKIGFAGFLKLESIEVKKRVVCRRWFRRVF